MPTASSIRSSAHSTATPPGRVRAHTPEERAHRRTAASNRATADRGRSSIDGTAIQPWTVCAVTHTAPKRRPKATSARRTFPTVHSRREVIFFENKRSLDKFKSGEFAFAAQASAVAATAGASADADYRDGTIVFTVEKGGLMYEASIGGQNFDFEPL